MTPRLPEKIVIVKTVPADRSWWADPYQTREDFDQRVQAELDRMQGGKFGRGVWFDRSGQDE